MNCKLVTFLKLLPVMFIFLFSIYWVKKCTIILDYPCMYRKEPTSMMRIPMRTSKGTLCVPLTFLYSREQPCNLTVP